MANRKGGFIGQDGLNAPDEPTGVSASAGDEQATISFTAPSDAGGSAITGYVATSDDGIGATGSSSPITVTGLSNGSAYTFRVWALNAFGYSAPSDASGSVTPTAPARAATFGGYNSSFVIVNSIEYAVISTTGNFSDFGDLTSVIYVPSVGCAGSATRSLRSSGSTTTSEANAVNTIDYVNLNTTGNATDFGDLSINVWSSQQCSSSTRAVMGTGESSAAAILNTLEYVTIASTGNATDFGDLISSGINRGGALASPTRGIFAGDFDNSANAIQYITIASTGNATAFGDLSLANGRYWFATASSDTRGLFAGGYEQGGTDYSNVISYITIASTGNSVDFGDLSVGRNTPSGAAGDGRAVFGGGYDSGGIVNTVDYVTIASTGNATDFGDLSVARYRGGSMSSGHGGIS